MPVLLLVAQETDSRVESVVGAATEAVLSDVTIIDPSELGLTGDVPKLDNLAANLAIDLRRLLLLHFPLDQSRPGHIHANTDAPPVH